MKTIGSLHEKRNALLAEANANIHDKTKFDGLIRESDELQREIDALTKVESYFAKNRDIAPKAPAPVSAPTIIQSEKEIRQKTNAAWRSVFRNGYHPQTLPEQRDLLTTNADSGALIAQSFDTTFTDAAKFFGPAWNLINRRNATTAAPTKFVVADGTAQTFSLLTEGTTTGSSVAQTPNVSSDVTGADTLISSVIYSAQELDDAFDLESFLTRVAGAAVSRAWEKAITVAQDSFGAPLPNSPTGGLLALAANSIGVTQTTGTLTAGPTYSQLAQLAGSVDRAYYATGGFMASSSVESFLREQTDSTGRALYQIDEATGFLRIAGKLLYPNAAMPALGTPSVPLVLFGDYSKFWNVLNAGGLQIKILTESPNTNMLSREMLLYTRVGQSAGLSSAVKCLKSAAN